MNRKNKILAALAIGAVVLCVGSGVARCSLAQQEDPAIQQGSSQEQKTEKVSIQQADEQGGFADLENTSWTSEDGKSTLSIIGGAFVEKTEGGSSVIYYTISDEKESNGTLTVTLSVSSSMTGEEQETIAQVKEAKDGGKTLVCDKLSAKYLKDAPVETTIALEGATDELYSTFGKDEAAFTDVLLEYSKAKSPYATKATWDKEVWIDFASGAFLTNFTLNDTASTIVSVKMDRAGRLVTL